MQHWTAACRVCDLVSVPWCVCVSGLWQAHVVSCVWSVMCESCVAGIQCGSHVLWGVQLQHVHYVSFSRWNTWCVLFVQCYVSVMFGGHLVWLSCFVQQWLHHAWYFLWWRCDVPTVLMCVCCVLCLLWCACVVLHVLYMWCVMYVLCVVCM